MKVVFLHIPKTAGQSVHAALVDAFGEAAVCPARVNEQLRLLSIAELNRYQVFSGHLDWSMLDCLKGPTYVFTVLREPMDRLLSFYFYLREQGAAMPAQQRSRPEHQGLKAAFELAPRDYFLGGPPHLRNFIDDHYDNFYAHYFAGRHYRARGELAALGRRGLLTRDALARMAVDNLSRLDAVFALGDIERVFETIDGLAGRPADASRRYEVNINQRVAPADRRAELLGLGADGETLQRLASFCELDERLWRLFAPAPRACEQGAAGPFR
jgi:hypothetical protein